MMMSSPPTQNVRKERHPLFNPIILERIFESLNVKNLKKIRLVCKFWNKIASPFLSLKSEVVLIRGKDFDKRRYSYKTFLSYIESLPEEPTFFRNYHINHWILNESRERSLLVFWTKCGPFMKELHLRDIIFYEVDTIRNVLYNWTKNLESLVLEDCLFYKITDENIPPQCEEYSSKEDFDEDYIFFDYYDHVTVEQLKYIELDETVPCNVHLTSLTYDQLDEEVFPLDWNEVFAAYPNLKELKLSTNISEQEISLILSKTKNLCLDSLSFFKSSAEKGPSHIGDDNLVQISDFPKLQQLDLFLEKNISPRAIEIVFKQHKSTLRTLKLFSPREKDTPEQYISCFHIFDTVMLPRLESLTVSSHFLYEEMFRTLPSLKNLRVWESSGDFNWEDAIDQVFLNKVIAKQAGSEFPELHTFSCGYPVKTLEFFLQLFNHFPNLKVLEASLNDKQIREVFRSLTALEEITVHDRYLTDEGITGHPILLTEDTEWCPNAQREFPYIGDLKNLQRFTFKYWQYDITDMSVYHGFINVANLAYLHLTKTQITHNALKDLALKSSLITLISPTVSKGGVL